jgi:hypothetical protein
MAEVVDTRASAMFVEVLSITKTDELADFCEIILNTAVTGRLTILKKKERRWADTKDSGSFEAIGAKALYGTCRYWNEAGPAVLSTSDGNHGLI